MSLGVRPLILVLVMCLDLLPSGDCAPCDSNPCVHGSCTNIDTINYSCACDPGWEDPDCDKGGLGGFAECVDDSDCNGQGTCETQGTQKFCLCNNAFGGEDCSLVCRPADIVFILDGSGSVGSNNFNLMKALLEELVGMYDVGPTETQFGSVTYSTTAQVDFTLNQYTTDATVIGALNLVTYPGDLTDTPRGLATAASLFTVPNGDRPVPTNVVVLLTDGFANRFEGSQTNVNNIYEQRAAELRALGHVIVLGIANAIEDEISFIASDDDSYTVNVPFNEMFQYLLKLKKFMCEATTICTDTPDYCVHGTCDDTPSGRNCTCDPGWTGVICNTSECGTLFTCSMRRDGFYTNSAGILSDDPIAPTLAEDKYFPAHNRKLFKNSNDKCKFYWMTFFEENWTCIGWQAFSFGVHPTNLKKFWRNFAFEPRNQSGIVQERGHKSSGEISTFPYTIVSPVHGITVVLDETEAGDGWTVTVEECCYQLTVYKKKGCDTAAERAQKSGRLLWEEDMDPPLMGECGSG